MLRKPILELASLEQGKYEEVKMSREEGLQYIETCTWSVPRLHDDCLRHGSPLPGQP
jgi:hypothetical protein